MKRNGYESFDGWNGGLQSSAGRKTFYCVYIYEKVRSVHTV